MKPQLFSTPILFLIFNRPDTTEKVFQQISRIKPHHFFISADGPRKNNKDDEQNCAEARRITEKVNWDCELKTNFSDNNKGCRVGVSSGIDWFFNHVSEGIILEDDCFPDISFFHFCETLLEHYRNDERIMHIGGVNFQDGRIRGTGSYYFSEISHVWGWATWKRAWKLYDVNISELRAEEHRFHEIYPNRAMMQYWLKNFELVYRKEKDTWDFQWQYAMSVHNGLAIIPNVNLVSNIGFHGNATHTKDSINILANRPTESVANVRHPAFVAPDLRADRYTFRQYLRPNKLIKLWRLIIYRFLK
jgi:hypothetical protein